MIPADCINLLVKEFNITKEKSEEIFNQIQSSRFELESKSLKDSIDKEMSKLIKKQADQEKFDLLERKKLKIHDLKTVSKMIDTVSERLDVNPKMSVYDAIDAEMAGKPQTAKSIDSIEVHAKVKSEIMSNAILDDFKTANISPELLQQETFFGEVTKGLLGKAVSNSPDVQTAIKIMSKHRDIFYKELKTWRPDVGFIENYVPQLWQNNKMIKYGADEWVSDIMKVADWGSELSPKNINSLKDSLSESYNKIIEGYSVDEFLPEIKFGGGLKGEGLVKKRVIHIPDPDDWYNMAVKYGNENGITALSGKIRAGAYNLGIIERVGVRPEQNLIKALKAISLKYPDRSNYKKIKNAIDGSKFKRSERLGRLWANVDKSVQNVYDPSAFVHKLYILESFRQTTSKLGSAQLSALTDPFVDAINAKFRGESLLKAWGNNILNVFRRAPKVAGGTKTVAEYASVFADNAISDVVYRYDPLLNEIPGRLADLSRKFFKWSLLTPWTDHMRSNNATTLSFDLAKKALGGYEQLPKKFKSFLNDYNISKDEFNILSTTLIKDRKGRDFVDFGSIEDPAIRNKFYKLMINEVDNSVLMPQAGDMVYTNWGFDLGTPQGRLMRLMMKFKTFPIAYMRRQLIPAIKQTSEGDVGFLPGMLIGSTTMGYLAMSAKDIRRGNTPRPLDQWETFVSAFMQGGGMGLMGDFVLQEYSTYGQSPQEVLLGPTASESSKLIKWTSGLVRGEVPSIKEVLRFGIGATPFANIWYTRAAINHLFLHSLYQDLDPAYLSRMKSNLRKSGQKQFIKPLIYN